MGSDHLEFQIWGARRSGREKQETRNYVKMCDNSGEFISGAKMGGRVSYGRSVSVCLYTIVHSKNWRNTVENVVVYLNLYINLKLAKN